MGDGFTTGGWVDLAWITAFAIIGAAGVQACRDSDHEEGRVDVTRLALVLPYVPFTLGMAVIAERVWTDDVGGMETLWPQCSSSWCSAGSTLRWLTTRNRWRRFGPDIAAFAGPQPQGQNSPTTTSARLLPHSS